MRLPSRLSQAAAQQRRVAGREFRSAWGGKRVKTVEGMVVFVQPGAEQLQQLQQLQLQQQPRQQQQRQPDHGKTVLLPTADIPCVIMSRKVRPAAKGESGKFVQLRPLHTALRHLLLDEVHSSQLVPLHAHFASAWSRHGEEGGEGDGSDCAMRDALVAAVQQQRDRFATAQPVAQLFADFAPGVAVPDELLAN